MFGGSSYVHDEDRKEVPKSVKQWTLATSCHITSTYTPVMIDRLSNRWQGVFDRFASMRCGIFFSDNLENMDTG